MVPTLPHLVPTGSPSGHTWSPPCPRPGWSPPGPHLVVPTWSPLGPTCSPPGPTWSPPGPHVVPTWSPRGPHVFFAWAPGENLAGARWDPREDQVVARWEPRGDQVGTRWEPGGNQVRTMRKPRKTIKFENSFQRGSDVHQEKGGSGGTNQTARAGSSRGCEATPLAGGLGRWRPRARGRCGRVKAGGGHEPGRRWPRAGTRGWHRG